MVYEFRCERRVEFVDTDMAGILHFSNYFRYMEAAEHAFFRSLGLTLHAPSDTGACGAARMEAQCSYRRPLRYEDVVELHLQVLEKRTRSLRYQVVFRLGEEEVARGSMVVVFVAPDDGDGGLRAVPIPTAAAAQIDAVPDGDRA